MESLHRFFARLPSEVRLRLLLACMVAVIAVWLGFVVTEPAQAQWLIKYFGYYFILVVVVLFGFAGLRLYLGEGLDPLTLWRGHRPGLLAVLACSLLVLSADRFTYKMLFDEYVIQSTAQNMHLTKEVGALIRGYTLSGSYLPIDAMMDKRPYLQPFLVSVLHDLTGYRTANIFIINGTLVPILLGLVYYIGRRLSNTAGGIASVVVLSTLPLLGQVATGAGMEMLNVTMLVVTVTAAIRYIDAPDERRLVFLCLSSVLLSQCRYESALYAVPVAVCVLWGWWKSGRILLPWVVILTPLLFVPYAMHNRVVAATPRMWELGEGQSARFSLSYLQDNLVGFWRYFFVRNNDLTASLLLSVSGLLSILAFPFARRQHLRRGESRFPLRVFLLFSLFVAGNLGLLMFYYWARLDDPTASRFALPVLVVLSLMVGYSMGWLCGANKLLWKAAGLLAGVYVMAILRPSTAHAFYTEFNQAARIVEWQVEYIHKLPPRNRLVVANRSVLPYIIEEQASITLTGMRMSLDKIRFHVEQGTFQEVLLVQTLRPSSSEGDYYVDAADKIPEGCRTEVLTEKRFGAAVIRISRVLTFDSTPGAGPEKEVLVENPLNVQ